MSRAPRCHLVLAALLSTACAGPPFAALGLDGAPVDGAMVSDTELRDVLQVGPAVRARDASGCLSFAMAVRSIDDEPLDVVADLLFVDGAGQPVAGGSVRRYLRLEPWQPVSCAAAAPGAAAASCTVAFDWSR